MNNITEEAKNKIQDLLKSDSLIEALNVFDHYSFDFNTLIMLKAQVNRLLLDKGFIPPNDYHIQFQGLKKSIYALIDIKYQAEEIVLENQKENSPNTENTDTENRIRNSITKLEGLIQNPMLNLLKRRFNRLVKEKNNIHEQTQLKRFFIQIEFSLNELANQSSIDLEHINQNQNVNTFNNKLTLREELEYLISQNQHNKLKSDKLKILLAKHLELEKKRNIGAIDYGKYFIGLNRIDAELELEVKKL